MNVKEFDALEANTGILMTAWDRENNCAVKTCATFRGWCDHPDWGTAVTISYDNPNCHFEDIFNEGQKETETDISIKQFLRAVIEVLEVA